MRPLRWWSLSLVPGGFVAGHEAGYEAARLLGAPALTGGDQHGYVRSLVLIGVPFAFAAIARHLVAGIRAELHEARLGTMVAAQSTLFLAFELVEHAQVGVAPAQALGQPAVMLGLVGQAVAATLLYLIARASHRVAAAIVRRRPATGRAAVAVPGWAVVTTADAVAVVPSSSLSRRGPPPPVVPPLTVGRSQVALVCG